MQLSKLSCRAGIGLVAALPLLGGCAATNVPSVANNPADVCAVHRVGFTPGPSTADQAGMVAATTVIGAAGGALLGAAAGGREGAARGAIAGGVAGLVTGVAWASANAAQREQILAQRYGAISNFGSEVDRAQVAFDRGQACRRMQVAQLNTELRARRLDRPVAEARLAEIRSWQGDDIRLAQAMSERFGAQMNTQLAQVEEIQAGATQVVQAERSRPFQPYAAIVKTSAPVMREANGASEAGTQLRPGTVVQVSGLQNGWAEVRQGNRSVGYVRPTQLVRDGAPRTYTAQANEAIRAEPAPNASELGRVGPGQSRQVTATLPGWMAVRTSGTARGFVPSSAMAAGGSVEGQVDSMVRATATNAEVANTFGQTVNSAASAPALALDS